MQICDRTANELAEMIRKKEVSAVEVLDSCLERIAAVDGRPGAMRAEEDRLLDEDKQAVHAFITLTAERAKAQAAGIDKKIQQGQTVGPLAGVPFTVKDIFCVKGTPSTAASKILASFTAPYTATVVANLEAAGAVMLGKVNLDEFTYGSSNESTAFQPAPRNPWNLNRVPGGSSGGSVSSVAAGEAPLSLGTDTAGSIRQPAAFTGVVGLKPTYGRVSRYGLIAFGSSLDCPGPVARTVRDAALMLEVMAGPDVHDSTASMRPVPSYTQGLEASIKGKRIGLSPDYFMVTYPDPDSGAYLQRPIPEEMKRAVMDAAEQLAKAGAEIVDNVPMPNTRYGIPAYFVISRVEAASNLHRFDGVKYGYRSPNHSDDLQQLYRKSRAEGFGLQPKLRILMGMYVSATQYSEQYYKRAQQVRAMIRNDYDVIFDPQGKYRLDTLLTPTTPTSAFPIGDVYGDTVLMQYADQFTVPANHAGIPGIAIPAGLDDEHLPISIQFLGPDFSEAELLRFARHYEMATETAAWRQERPQILAGL
jgi:aspartyl-tRNA(Asn)/glutamyl-tRNA(Gln) amidotransferase subunit A